MYLLGFIFGFFAHFSNKRKVFYLFVAFLMALAIFRIGVGIDYYAYQYLFDYLSRSVVNELRYGVGVQEVGFRVLGSFFKSLGLSYQVYLGFFSIITLYYMSRIALEYSKNPTLTMLLFYSFYYFTWVFSGIRQGLVIAVGVYYLLKCIENEKIFRFFLIVAGLSLIHASSWILLLMYYASTVRFKKNTLMVVTSFSVVFSQLPVASIISRMTFLPFYSRLSPYLDTEFTFTLFDFQMVGRFIFLAIAFFYYRAYANESEFHRKVINIYILSLCGYFLLQFSELTAARLSIYGKFLDVIILTNIFYLYKDKANKIIYIFGILIISSLYFVKEQQEMGRAIQSDHLITPYTHIFNYHEYTFNSRYLNFIRD